MVVVNDCEKCCYCAGCVGTCPVLALEFKDGRIEVDSSTCTSCGNCVKICPVGAMSLKK